MGNNSNSNKINTQVITGQTDKKNSNCNKIEDEVFTGQGGEKIITLSDINKLSLSTCKITITIENKISKGTGFLIDLEDIGKGLMTCYHVLDINALKNKECIKFTFEVQSKELILNWDKYIRFIFTDPTLDITFIELFEEDFNFETCFLKYSLLEQYKNKHFLILQHPAGGNISYGEGQILSLNKNKIIHNVSTLPGSSGSGLILKNDDNRVIGVHNSGNEKIEENYATPITAELIDKIKDLKKFSYSNDKIFPCIKYAQFQKKIFELLKSKEEEEKDENNTKTVSLAEMMKLIHQYLSAKIENFDKEIEDSLELKKKFQKASFKLGWNELDYLIHVMVNIKSNDSYKNYYLINKNKFLDNLDFLKNSNQYCYPLSDRIEMETDDNYCDRHFHCMIYNIIISFWFDSENKEFFIDKALNQLKEEVKPLDKSDL